MALSMGINWDRKRYCWLWWTYAMETLFYFPNYCWQPEIKPVFVSIGTPSFLIWCSNWNKKGGCSNWNEHFGFISGQQYLTFTANNTFFYLNLSPLKGLYKKEFQRGIKKLNISIAGNPVLSAESKITIPDIKYLKDKEWIINNVTHEISDQGYISQITALIKS